VHDAMPDVLIERENSILTARKSQLEINIAAWHGGRGDVDKRLERYAGEESLSWTGGRAKDGGQITGRKQQAFCIPLCGRLIDKSNQYLFSKPPKRNNAKDEFVANATRDGVTLQDLMKEINSYLTVTNWCWLGIDMPVVESAQTSVANKEAQNIRPYWQVYSPLDVVDWQFNSQGQLLWLITSGVDEITEDPRQKAQVKPYRILWEPGKATKTYYKADGKERKADGVPIVVDFGYNGVPFVLCGKPSKLATLFDDLETLQRALMNLVSSHHQNLYSCVYPQMVLPESAVRSDDNSGKAAGQKTMQVGLKHPLSEAPEDSGISRYIAPPADAITPLAAEVIRVKQEFFELAGFMLRRSTAQVESGESKKWDAQETRMFFLERAGTLQSIERKAIKISNEWDPWFAVYEPEYSKDFNIDDFMSDIQTLALGSSISMPDELHRVVLKQIFDIFQKMREQDLDTNEVKTVLEAIENYTKTVSTIPMF
jgi:hypothetical protein